MIIYLYKQLSIGLTINSALHQSGLCRHPGTPSRLEVCQWSKVSIDSFELGISFNLDVLHEIFLL